MALELQSHAWIKMSSTGEVKLDIIGNNEIPTDDDAFEPHPSKQSNLAMTITVQPL